MLNPAQLARIDVSLLVVFSTVLEERQVLRAADRLNLTPSAVSHGLRRLRRIFHDPLFLKTPNGVKPTERALALAGSVAELLSRLDAIVSAAAPFDARTVRRSFTIGAPDALAAVFLGSLLEILAREAPGIDIRLLQLMPQRHGKSSSDVWQDTLSELDSHRLDLAVLPTGPLPSRYAERLLFEEDFVVAMRKRHRMARKVTLAAYLAAPHLLVSAIGDALGIVDVRLAERGHSRRVALTVPNFMMALAQLAESDFIATLPRHLVERHAARFDLVIRPVPFPWTPDPVRVVASQAAIADAGVAWLFETVARCIGAVSRSAPRRRVSA
ncbi:LysR family transcriptional regulator [Bradyrhizobium sp. WBOS7]|uniref:LysR family transcriptional regulator n=1 Tax=Bradyrhizobium betae TaxID=244734 RepID=A0AAE9N8F5_9BRAD|nr:MULTISPECIES: LysR family transcriptional regulator [Bradyrhizobium]MDD1570476.1 LysR family transcriptional regulator [Bradyrhizobium sp. WBOS1]UUO35050.1 LysR family transcriptional regulator [Bradyrhizobium sp. WBOS01]MDD1527322.1 LysR family transcriptional regulator [Bradyrhizobium sp. WBOS2]MDD1579733.1 LysR family transcriptional regulator [Bradyrhizobium sp. WBOS7]MDD1604452.1 LysR family transcriptional regulator [Bradyrhizobium sp. WBOS16]